MNQSDNQFLDTCKNEETSPTIVDIDKLKSLDFTKQKIFVYLVCERLYPNYVYFSNNYNFGRPAVLKEATDYLYDSIFEIRPDNDKIKKLIQRVEKNTPDTENHDTIFVSSALDACTAILDSLDFFTKKDFEKITNIRSYAFDTIDMYIREMENIEASDKEYIQKVHNHHLMIKELSIQSGIITYLHKSSSVEYGDIQTLLLLQENNKRGSLNL